MTWLFFAEAALHRPLWWSSACWEPAMQWRLYTSTSLTTKRWQCWGSAGYCKVPKLLLRGLYLSLPVISGLWGKTSTSVSVVVLDLGADFALACDLQMQKGSVALPNTTHKLMARSARLHYPHTVLFERLCVQACHPSDVAAGVEGAHHSWYPPLPCSQALETAKIQAKNYYFSPSTTMSRKKL